MTPKGSQGMDWNSFCAIIGLGFWLLAYSALIIGILWVIAHFIVKYW